MKGLKIAALAVLFDALFPLAAFMIPKPFIALTPLFQRAEVSQAALSWRVRCRQMGRSTHAQAPACTKQRQPAI